MTETPLIRRSPVPPSDCNLWKAFELIGDRWILVILRSALYGLRRFDDFQNELDIPRSILSNRLARLVDSGLMERREYREDRQRSRIEYPLTKMGQSLGLSFTALTEWSDHWIGNGSGPLALRSKTTGQKLAIALVDENGKSVRRDDVETVITLPSRASRRPQK
ncbi:DNA-binding HxlR family transcriptional regulator [Afipia massiliensis]|uniref:DNA-binding HxlR family transcriptional regulator n=1 Tax=Afipia massiliensis TaxID=211460 RepID=A0A840N8L3_9BRAD|nr:helix-turn-helix domain-containing protein [Afipia massiliensis]MBB5055152.1 DNA-binding HxlR family transcriptional regulator [Afipia massiliensis]